MSPRSIPLSLMALLLFSVPAGASEPRDPAEPTARGAPDLLTTRREALYRTFQRASGTGQVADVGAGNLSPYLAFLPGIALTPVGVAALVDGDHPAIGVGLLVGGGLALSGGIAAVALGQDSPYRDVVAEAGLQASFATAYLGIALSGRTTRSDGSTFGLDRVHLGPLSTAIAGYATTGLLIAEGVSRPRTSAATLRRDARQLADVSSYLALGEDDVARIEGDLGATLSRWPGWLRAMPHLLATGASLGVALGERDGDERLLAAASGLSSLLLAFLAAMEDPDLLAIYRDELEGVAIDLVISGDGVGLSGRF